MRLLEESYGEVRIFSERPFGYKRYIVEWANKHTGFHQTQIYSGLWYSLDKVKQLVEDQLGENE